MKRWEGKGRKEAKRGRRTKGIRKVRTGGMIEYRKEKRKKKRRGER